MRLQRKRVAHASYRRLRALSHALRAIVRPRVASSARAHHRARCAHMLATRTSARTRWVDSAERAPSRALRLCVRPCAHTPCAKVESARAQSHELLNAILHSITIHDMLLIRLLENPLLYDMALRSWLPYYARSN
eukprot:2425260-Pleurochrysis_carterae.AAC.3